jgi:CRISPR-associated endoribonuclease Cas6
LRLLLELNALNDQIVCDSKNYGKVQGFIYDELINKTQFKGIHESKSYKFFCFSNIFPPSPAKKGELRYITFSSPNNDLVKLSGSTSG